MASDDPDDPECLHDVSTAVQRKSVNPIFKEVFELKLDDRRPAAQAPYY